MSLLRREWLVLINSPCTYCGDGEYIVGIDRVDSSKGYTPGNSVPCCTMCNWMKLDHKRSDFLWQVEKIYWHAKWEEEKVAEEEGRVERFLREQNKQEVA